MLLAREINLLITQNKNWLLSSVHDFKYFGRSHFAQWKNELDDWGEVMSHYKTKGMSRENCSKIYETCQRTDER